jgi:O-antigen biosynthesis protein
VTTYFYTLPRCSNAIQRMTITQADRLQLDPEEGVELHNGQTVAAKLPVWLRLERSDHITCQRWVRLRYSSSMFDEPVRPLIRFTTATGEQFVEAMNGPILGSAEWIGRVPDHTISVQFSPCRRLGPFSFRLDSIDAVSRLSLVRSAIARDPLWVFWAARSRILNSRREAWQALKFGAAATPIEAYASWRTQFSRPLELEGLDRPRTNWNGTPSFRFFMRLDSANLNLLQRTITSLKQQIYPYWSLHVAADETTTAAAGSALREAVGGDPRLSIVANPQDWLALAQDLGPTDYLAIIELGDTLPGYALAILAEQLARDPRLAAIYTDEDVIGQNDELSKPILKPDWSPALNQGARYVGRLAFVRFELVGPLGLRRLLTDEHGLFDQVLARLARNEVGHVRRILYHRRELPAGEKISAHRS